jgi:hypothetical protein
MYPLSKNNSMTYGLEVEHKFDNNIVIGAGLNTVRLKGEELLYVDGQGNGIYGNNQYRGTLYYIPLVAGYRFSKGKVEVTPQVGIAQPFFKANYPCHEGWNNGEYYRGTPQVDTIYVARCTLGYTVNKHLVLELMYHWADLDIDSGTYQIGVCEDKSNLSGIAINMRYTF